MVPREGAVAPQKAEYQPQRPVRPVATGPRYWAPALSAVTLLIPGTGSVGHPEENMAAGSLTLSEEYLAELG